MSEERKVITLKTKPRSISPGGFKGIKPEEIDQKLEELKRKSKQ